MKLYDIHNHLVPYVDDGSRSMDETILMIEQYIESGYGGVIATSHYDKGRYVVEANEVLAGLAEIREELDKRGITFDLYPGNEIQLEVKTVQDIVDRKVLRLNNSRYVLCELPMLTKPSYVEDVVYEMQLNGWTPIIAHPERYTYVQENPDWLLPFIKKGCLVQMNLSSLFNPGVQELSRSLLNKGLVHLIGTDAHQSEWRSPQVKEQLEELNELIGTEKFEVLTSINPRKVIDDEMISSTIKYVSQEKVEPKKKKWYKFWE